ncbi:MAG: cbb3-type cytochrome c oxidase N-terminal domain-containing protein, partial [Gammaproteobacteria bacterium]|nr:cbb3-type cytochrome c oxidase N-terminal domain-containing protein [Gammaproteobacteria bacterium]
MNALIVVLTVASLAAMLWLLWDMRHARLDQPFGDKTTGHVWDGDLKELNNPLPRWWLWLFVITIVFSIVYLVLYPGLGSYAGTLGWTQQKQHAAQQLAAERAAQQILAPLAELDLTQLIDHPTAQQIGRNLYATHCALCHGSDARGAIGFPNLVDDDWLWGGSEEAILTSIRD